MTPIQTKNNHIKKYAHKTQTFSITLIYTKKIITLKKDIYKPGNTYITLFTAPIFSK